MIKESNVHDLPNAKIQQHDSITDEEIAHFIQLLIHVIPVSHIFRCAGATSPCRLIIILDRYRYQESKQTEALLTFITLNQSNIHLLYFTYGTMNDYLLRGHYFFSRICIPANCIYHNATEHVISTSMLQIQKLQQEAEQLLNSGLRRINDYLQTAEILISQRKLNLASFMLHQCCEQIYRLIIIIFKGRECKSHQLVLLYQTAAFYFPPIRNIFHSIEKKELRYLDQLQGAYIGARYQDEYEVAVEFLSDVLGKLDACVSAKLRGLIQEFESKHKISA